MTRTMKLMTVAMATSALTLIGTGAGVDAQTTSQPDRNQPPQQQAAEIDLNDLEENPASYVGKRVTVRGEVQEVLGPRMFSLDENNWIDFDGETLVYMKAPNVAILRENDEVRISGTVQRTTDVRTDLNREWGWMDPDPDYDAELNKRAVIVADSVSVTDAARNLFGREERTTGVTGGARTTGDRPTGDRPMGDRMGDDQPITDVTTIAGATGTSLVGRKVRLQDVTIHSKADQGYWASVEDDHVFVLPATSQAFSNGDKVTIEGTILQFPRTMRSGLGDMARGEEVYIYANTIRK